jgi:hypothetical protein
MDLIVVVVNFMIDIINSLIIIGFILHYEDNLSCFDLIYLIFFMVLTRFLLSLRVLVLIMQMCYLCYFYYFCFNN